MNKLIIISTDGGARGNPGPAAVGAVINFNGENHEYKKAIGKTTNNVAEYFGAIFGLKKAKELIGKKEAKKKDVEVRMDSQLVVRQINGEYKLKEETLHPYFIKLWNLKQDFNSVKFKYIPREENKEADSLVNSALDTLL